MEQTTNAYELFNPYIVNNNFFQIQHNDTFKNKSFGQRIVRWYELELIYSCDGGRIRLEGNDISLSRGTLLFRCPGTVVEGFAYYGSRMLIFDPIYTPSLDAEYSRYFLENPSVQLLKTFETRNKFDLLEKIPPILKINNYEYMESLFKKSLTLFLSNSSEYQFYAKSILYEILSYILKESSLKNLSASYINHYPIIMDIKNHIDQHYAYNLGVSELAAKAYMSISFFSRTFKKIMGVSPIEYIIHTRIYHAKRLLLTSQYSIDRIASLAGFTSKAYFFTTFKRHVSMTPENYRKYNSYLI